MFKEAKNYCDWLICGVLSDEAIMEKKPRPILDFYERFFILRGIKYIDEIVPQEVWNPLEICSILKPDVLFESPDNEQPANDYVKSYGGIVIQLPYLKLISSREIKRRLEMYDSNNC
jgi:glycerol-3-phosphate cytidylyltransferase-like family protein